MLLPVLAFSQSDGKYIGLFMDSPDETTIIYDTIRINIEQSEANLCDVNWNNLEGSSFSKLKNAYIIYHPKYNYFLVSGSEYDDNKLVVTQHKKGYYLGCQGGYFKKNKTEALKIKVDKTIAEIGKTSNVIGSKLYTSKNGKRVQLMEITKNGVVHLILLDPIVRKDYLEIEEIVLALRKDYKLFKGFTSLESYQFKFYKDNSEYTKKSLPTIWSTYYNNWTGGKRGMAIIWGFSDRKTVIVHYPNRKIVKI